MLDVQLQVLLRPIFALEQVAFNHVVLQTQALGRHVDNPARPGQSHSMNVNRHFDKVRVVSTRLEIRN